MPNSIGPDGLTVATQAELLSQLTAALETIYGADIDIDPDTPDGQWMNIIIQLALDLEDLLVAIYNGFDPDNAIGAVLDQRVAINGIQRQAGTFTEVGIVVTTSQSVNLYGLDQDIQTVFTVQDPAGNQYQLLETQLGFNEPSGESLNFQAVNEGAVTPTVNTITIPVTIVLGVTSVNNPSRPIQTGEQEETDAALRVRRQRSVSLASQGYLAGLLSALQNLSGMIAAFVYENDTDETDGDGVGGHSIWVIVNFVAPCTAAQVANAIYTKRNAGCGMKGSQSFVITQVNGTLFTVLWDITSNQNLFTQFTLGSINGTGIPNIAAISAGLVNTFTPGVFQEVNINELATLVQQIDPNSLVLSPGFSLNSSGPFNNNVLQPSSKANQFQISAANIIILPMIIAPQSGGAQTAQSVSVSGGEGSSTIVSTAQIPHGGNSMTMATLGGYGTDHSAVSPHLTYSILSGGGSIVSATGVYTSGAAGTDVIQVEDANGNTAICTVTVT